MVVSPALQYGEAYHQTEPESLPLGPALMLCVLKLLREEGKYSIWG
jgi:hypothetical protein